MLLATCCGLLAGATAAAAAKTWPVTLSQQDQAQIAVAACGATAASGAERIVASTSEKGSTRISAEVRCKSQASIGKFPLLHYTTCGNARGTWRCEAGYDAIHMTLPDLPLLPVVAAGVTQQVAVEAITAASKQIVPPFHTPATHLMRGRCKISPHPTTPSKEMQLFDIQCTGTSMLLTRHCFKGGCRHFISQGEGY